MFISENGNIDASELREFFKSGKTGTLDGLKIKRNDWLLSDTCPQAANHCAFFWVWELTQVV